MSHETVALVFGVNDGIGGAAVAGFLDRGWRVVGIDPRIPADLAIVPDDAVKIAASLGRFRAHEIIDAHLLEECESQYAETRIFGRDWKRRRNSERDFEAWIAARRRHISEAGRLDRSTNVGCEVAQRDSNPVGRVGRR